MFGEYIVSKHTTGVYSWVRTSETHCFCYQSKGENNPLLISDGITDGYEWPFRPEVFYAHGYIAGELW